MKNNTDFKEWYQVIAAVITVAGGLLLVWMQTSQATRDTQVILQDFKEVVSDSIELRKAVVKPLEGRWNYRVDWDTYYNVSADSNDPLRNYFSIGIAEIRWEGPRKYAILLGYENKNDDDTIFSVSINTGHLITYEASGLPKIGEKFQMFYAHRLAAKDIETDGKNIDYTKTENYYFYTIENFEIDSTGRVCNITANYDEMGSRGSVTFTRP